MLASEHFVLTSWYKVTCRSLQIGCLDYVWYTAPMDSYSSQLTWAPKAPSPGKSVAPPAWARSHATTTAYNYGVTVLIPNRYAIRISSPTCAHTVDTSIISVTLASIKFKRQRLSETAWVLWLPGPLFDRGGAYSLDLATWAMPLLSTSTSFPTEFALTLLVSASTFEKWPGKEKDFKAPRPRPHASTDIIARYLLISHLRQRRVHVLVATWPSYCACAR